MALSDRLVNEVQFKCPGSTVNAIRMEVWNVLDDFCREGLAWRETLSVPLTLSVLTYDLTTTDSTIVHVFNIHHPTLDLQNSVYEWNQLQLYTPPKTADLASPVSVVAALAPAIDQGADLEHLVPDDMWTTYHRTFVKGVLGLMMSQAAKPYSNPQLAAVNWRGYLSDRDVARRSVATDGQPGAQLWAFPRFGT
jgi:hypothetical protein